MQQILTEPIQQYLTAKQTSIKGNKLADKLRNEFPKLIENILPDKNRYKVLGSAGQGQWTESPWIAILDRLITESPQSGYYPVFLFKADMTGVYLSLNQGVTEIRENYKRDAIKVLQLRAEDFRAKLGMKSGSNIQVKLFANTTNAKMYEAGNIVAKYYPANDLPTSDIIRRDILSFLQMYDELAFNDIQFHESNEFTALEKKQYRLHYRIERNNTIATKVKKLKGYECEVCRLNFEKMYGDIGRKFIEAHHLRPLNTLNIGNYTINLFEDFAVLCSNCHSMIHRLDNPGDLEEIRKRINFG
jgi:5-methylcytosine-specific restriction protein A